AHSGAMWLSGRPGSAPVLAPGEPAGLIERHLADYAAATAARTGTPADGRAPLADSRLLGERAALAELSRRGPFSAGRAFRAVPTADGWLGLSLARPDDLDLVPALVEGAVADPWDAVAAWARTGTTGEAFERARLLGLPAAAWPPAPATRPAVRREPGARRALPERPLVVDLTSLWAGPLCAHLLGLAGCRVVKVESTRRLDGARRGPAAFYDLLHAGHDSVALDFTDPDDRRRLADLLGRADLVLEGSRPRALEALGIDAREYVASGVSWLSITARGRQSDTVGFGDDVAVAAGLAVVDGDDLLPVGDALADPLTGAAAAAAAAQALLADEASLLDISMLDVTREAVGPTPDATVIHHDGDWWVDTATGRHLVAAPVARPAPGPAAAAGQHNEVWLP
ncbi:CoA transferase, partial [Nocardioides sp. P5_C9_2]